MDRHHPDAALLSALPVVCTVHSKTETRREHAEHAVPDARLRQTKSLQLLRLCVPGPVHLLTNLPVLSADRMALRDFPSPEQLWRTNEDEENLTDGFIKENEKRF